MSDNDPKAQRFDLLSSSESGLSYVREKRGGTMRVLTETELADFNDPPPVLPGYDGSSWKPAPDGVYFVIGPDKQLDAYESTCIRSAGRW